MDNLMTQPPVENSYSRKLELEVSPPEVSAAIDRVTAWWSAYVTGDTSGAGRTFSVRFSEDASETFVDFRVAEHVAGRRIVWEVTDCYLPWLADKTEWTGTSVIFDLSPTGRGTMIDFAHKGLVPQVECYASCVKGWDQYILGSLRQFVETGTGRPN
jgi:hypothetical protein